MARLKDKYLNEVVPGLQEQFKYTNVMAIPKLDKVVVNIGLGEAVQNPKSSGRCPERFNSDYRSEACCNQSKKIYRWFQIKRRYASRCKSNFAWRPYV